MKRLPVSPALIISLLGHAGLLVLLAVSVDFSAERPQPTQSSAPVVQATVVDSDQVKKQVDRIRAAEAAQQEAERQRQAERERKAKEAERKRQQEQEQIRRLEQERQQRQQEIKKAEEAAKQARLKQEQEERQAKAAAEKRRQEEAARAEAERKRKVEEAAAAKAEAERKAKAEAERKAAEARKQREAEEAARRAREAELADMMAAEQAELAQARQRQVLSEVDRYSILIRQAIKRHLRTDSNMRGKQCRVRLNLAPDGFVFNYRVLGGDTAVCRATEAAIKAAGNLPVSEEPDVYNQMKEIDLRIEPEL
ncbi:cell envelope integrity protein TolA [Ferrimonas gelatinilytica]|uniref:Cell envelope integrity protein TolA n=1 Tax=Ferrimonas gelatinilytica TaxID=1255257 RepID=A0ABP9RY12_9GAMM